LSRDSLQTVKPTSSTKEAAGVLPITAIQTIAVMLTNRITHLLTRTPKNKSSLILASTSKEEEEEENNHLSTSKLIRKKILLLQA
jgi:aspartyl aminopeptidase